MLHPSLVKTFVVYLALSGVALAKPRVISLAPVTNLGPSLESFCKQSNDAAEARICLRATDDSQCHDAKRWNPLGTSIVKEARVVELHGEVSRCVPAIRTQLGWVPFVDGGMAFDRKKDARVDRIDIVEPRTGPSYVLFRFATTQQRGITTPMDHETRSFAVCRVDAEGVACGTHAMENELDVKMREDGRIELMAHRESVAPGTPKVTVGATAAAQVGVYDLTR